MVSLICLLLSGCVAAEVKHSPYPFPPEDLVLRMTGGDTFLLKKHDIREENHGRDWITLKELHKIQERMRRRERGL